MTIKRMLVEHLLIKPWKHAGPRSSDLRRTPKVYAGQTGACQTGAGQTGVMVKPMPVKSLMVKLKLVEPMLVN